jgi:hypothetical protein
LLSDVGIDSVSIVKCQHSRGHGGGTTCAP